MVRMEIHVGSMLHAMTKVKYSAASLRELARVAAVDIYLAMKKSIDASHANDNSMTKKNSLLQATYDIQ